uniref:SAM-dependent methyltransferase n=1 Tax=Angiostrongylus cantonensis TaxID=6313 RepID=A0A0K0DFW7_ANGCA
LDILQVIFSQTVEVFRHGDRAPMRPMTSAESRAYYYRGREHLTNVGFLLFSRKQ